MTCDYNESNHAALLREKLETEWPNEDDRQAVDEYEEERRWLEDAYWGW